MKTSESIKEIAPALLNAQRLIGSASKDAVNPFFKSKYADLGSVMEACKDSLNQFNITVLQPVGSSDQGTTVETILLHSSGEFISDTMTVSIKQQNNPQDQGSAITYARRYSLQSMMFIPAEDDDAEKATDHKPQTAAEIKKNFPPTTMAEFDSGLVCKKCGNKNLEIRVSGPTSKRPGAEYWNCPNNRDGFVSYRESPTNNVDNNEISMEELNETLGVEE